MAVAGINEANLFSISRLADLFGHTRETISKKIKDSGAKPAAKRNGYPVFNIREIATFTGGERAEETGAFEEINPNKLAPKDRDAYYSSENRRLAFEKSQKQLLDKDETAQALAETLKKVALTFDTFADVLERDVGLSPEQIEKVNDICDNIRGELASELIKNTNEPS